MSRQCFVRRLFLLPIVLRNACRCTVAVPARAMKQKSPWLARRAILTGMCIISSATAFAQPFTLSRTFDDPTPHLDGFFGLSVAVDGNRVLISSPYDGTYGSQVGQAYLFDASAGTLLQTLDDPTPPAPDRQGDSFGYSVALDGNRILIGEDGDQAHLFDATTGDLVRTFDDPTPSNDHFGSAVALDGNHVLIGAEGDDTNGENAGQAHLFDATTGNLLQTFDDPTPTSGDAFGNSVALDGNLLLIGALLDDTHGENVGQAHLFDAVSGALLQTFDDPTPTSQDHFGRSVALHANHVLIGANNDDTNGENVGQAHLFDAMTGDLVWTFDDPTPDQDAGSSVGDLFGISVALDGNRVLIGAAFDDTNGRNVGQAHLFDATTGDLVQTFDDPTVTDADKFGFSVALDGSHVLIGAIWDDTNGETVGQAHLFTAVSEPSADFDDDGDVDGNDFLKWQRGESPIPLSASDLAAWQLNFGTTTPLASSTAIPEPSAIAMAVGCLIGLARRPCQRRELMINKTVAC